jgi:hypothetical protein
LGEIVYDRKTVRYFDWNVDGCERVRPWTFVLAIIVVVLLMVFFLVSVKADEIGVSNGVRTTVYVLIAILVFSLVMSVLVIFK